MAELLVNIVKNVDNNIAYGHDDRRKPSGQAHAQSRHPSETSEDAEGDLPPSELDGLGVESGVGLNVNREV